MAEGPLVQALKERRKFEEKAGHKETAEALRRELDEAKARRPKTDQARLMVLLFLPVPSLQNALARQMAEDEAGFYRAQMEEAESAGPTETSPEKKRED